MKAPPAGTHRVCIDGEATSDLLATLSAFEIDEGFSRPAVARVSFGPDDSLDLEAARRWAQAIPHFEAEEIDFGSRVEIDLFDGESWQRLFEGDCVAIRASFADDRALSVSVSALDDLYKLDLRRHSRVYEELGLEEVVQDVCSEHALVAEVDSTETVFEQLVQLDRSDLAFLAERARDAGFEVWMEDGTVRVGRFRAQKSFELRYPGELRELTASADLRGQASGTVVTGWDIDAAEFVEGRAVDSDPASARTTAAEILDEIHGEVVHLHAQPKLASEEVATELAEGISFRRDGRFVGVRGVARGDHRARVGRRMEITGVGPIFDGPYRTTRVVHTWSEDSEYTTRFEAERGFIGAAWR